MAAFANVVNEAFTISRRRAEGGATEDNQELGRPASNHTLHGGVADESGRESTEPVDFAFLATQTFGDAGLERELLALFVDQVRRILPTLPGLSDRGQADTAHLLKGSARGIGAWAAAEAAGAYEAVEPAGRTQAYRSLIEAFAEADAAIVAHLAGRRPTL